MFVAVVGVCFFRFSTSFAFGRYGFKAVRRRGCLDQFRDLAAFCVVVVRRGRSSLLNADF